MTTRDPSKPDIVALLAEALALPAAERAAFIASACAGDAAARSDLEGLLAAHARAAGFLAQPAVARQNMPTAPAFAGAAIAEDVGSQISHYRLLQLIGEGGFGAVFLAEQREPVSRRVALKIIKLGMDTRQVIARFEAERQALAMMDHPNIARVFDAGATVTGRPYFVMELVKGVPITDYCDQHRLTIEQRLALFRQVCGAVQHAHQKGVIHRDIKPSNVLVTLHDGQPTPKVIDFGIAKATSSRLTEKTLFTEFRQLIGTPEYMSPEQAEANATDIDTRSDVYSLGVLLYQLLTGATPFDTRRLRSAAFGELQRIIREEDPPKPSTRLSTQEALPSVAAQRGTEPARLTGQVRGDLDWIVMRALDKDRTRRYDSASALADDVRRHLDGEVVLAVPPSTAYRLKRFLRRHRTQAVAGSIIALALVGGSVGTMIGMLKARAAAQEAHASAAGAEAVNQFMSDVLTSVEPDEKGADVRLIEVLDDASRTASERFKGHPELEARVRDMLASVYTNLSMRRLDEAERKKAVALWESVGGPEHPRCLTSKLLLAGTYISGEDATRAEQILNQIAPAVHRVFGPDHRVTVEMQQLMGMTQTLRGNYDLAEQTLTEVRSRAIALGLGDGFRIGTNEALIRVHRRRMFSRDDHTADSILLDKMQALAEEVLELATRSRGPMALDTIDAQLRLADIECQRGRYQVAAATCRDVLASTAGRLGECHTERLYSMLILSFALSGQGQEQEAADLTLARLDCLRKQGLQIDEPVLLGSMSDALRFLERAGRAEQGEAMARQVSETLARLGGGHESVAAEVDAYLVRFISMRGRLAEAEPMFRSLIEQVNDDTESVDVSRARLRLFYGLHLAQKGQFAEAERQLDRASELAGDVRMGTMSTHPDDLLLGYITLYKAWNQPEKLARYEEMRAKLLAQLRANDHPPMPATAPTLAPG